MAKFVALAFLFVLFRFSTADGAIVEHTFHVIYASSLFFIFIFFY